jgi:CheY-like chemotaxis protein
MKDALAAGVTSGRGGGGGIAKLKGRSRVDRASGARHSNVVALEHRLRPRPVSSCSVVCRILLVEDDEPVADAWRLVLELEGFTVVQASNGSQVLELLSRLCDPFDLVISDHHLPGAMKGPDVISAVRSRQGADLPAFLVSGDSAADPGSLRDVCRLTKPVEVRGLIARIRESLMVER